MIKRLLLSSILLSFCLLLFPFAFAQESAPLSNPNPSPGPAEYILPYPGLLPDHPLYFLKRIRDTILGVLITHPVRRAEFHILRSDKKLNMSVFLLEKNNPEISVQALNESAKSLKDAYNLTLEIPAAYTLEVANLEDKLEKSIVKHIEIADAIHSQVGDEQRNQVSQIQSQFTELQGNLTRTR